MSFVFCVHNLCFGLRSGFLVVVCTFRQDNFISELSSVNHFIVCYLKPNLQITSANNNLNNAVNNSKITNYETRSNDEL